MLKLKQYLCKHDYKYLARNRDINEYLWQCNKCKVYYVGHLGTMASFKSKTKPKGNWIYDDIYDKLYENI